MKANKVHFAVRQRQGRSQSVCGSDRGLNSSNIVPLVKDIKDVTCKNCKRMTSKKK